MIALQFDMHLQRISPKLTYRQAQIKLSNRFSLKLKDAVRLEVQRLHGPRSDVPLNARPRKKDPPPGGLRRSIKAEGIKNGVYRLTAERYAPYGKDDEGFDVAGFTHYGVYNPTTPGTGPGYLTRAGERLGILLGREFSDDLQEVFSGTRQARGISSANRRRRSTRLRPA